MFLPSFQSQLICILIVLFTACKTDRSIKSNTNEDNLTISNDHSITPDKSYLSLEETYEEVQLLNIDQIGTHSVYAIRKGHKWGVSNPFQGAFIEPQYDDVASTKSSLAFKKDSVWHIYDNQYKKIGIIKEEIIKGHHESRYIVAINNKLALMDTNGGTDFVFDEITGPNESNGYFFGKSSNQWSAYDLNGLKVENLSNLQAVSLRALNEYKITIHGYGPIKIGMDIQSIEKVVGLKNVLEDRSPSVCKIYQFDDAFPKIRLLCEKRNGRMILERIYINDETIKTKSGIGIGSTEEEILQAYGEKMVKQPHKYSEKSSYYYFVPVDKKDQNYRLNFDYDSENIVHYSVGRKPSIFYVEGCY